MAKTYVVNSNRSLNGEVVISGSKNCALCLIAASLLIKDKTILKDIPHIKDIEVFCEILNYLNVKTEFINNDLIIDSTSLKYKNLKIPQIKSFRASYYLIGALINRYKKLEIEHFGGCNFVNRPINFHLNFFSFFGIKYLEDESGYTFINEANDEDEYTLPYPSFGTTINAILFAISSHKSITIKNICTEIEVLHFIDFIKQMGGNIIYQNSTVYIEPSVLHGISFKNIPDRIESGSFLLMGATICDNLLIKNICPLHNKELLDLFSLLDINYDLGDDFVKIKKTKIDKSCFIETGIGNHISSDLQPLLTVFCLTIPKISVIKEKVYSARFTHIEPLRKMGACIFESNQNILINGIMSLTGQEIVATDLRMAASMVYAGLLAEGKTTIYQADYLERGYENFAKKLISLGADIIIYEN